MLGGLMMKETGLVLDVARQIGGAMPSIVTLPDHSRFGNHGAMANVTWTQIPPYDLWVMNFNGANSVINCGNDESLNITDELSIEWWGRSSVWGGGGLVALLEKVVGAAGYMYMTDVATQMHLYILDGGFSFARHQNLTDRWYHFVGLYTTQIETYTNGVFDQLVAQGPPSSNTANLYIGARGGIPDRFFTGSAAMLKIYTYALSPGQILKHYEATRRFFGV